MATNNATNTSNPITVPQGGTGVATLTTAYAPVCAGTTATGPVQVASTGLATSGYVLTSNGSSAVPSFQAPAVAPLSFTPVTDLDSPYTVLAADDFLVVDVSTGPVTILLPNAPTAGKVFYVKDAQGFAATNNITVTTVSGLVIIDDGFSYVMNTNYESANFTYDGSNYWVF